MKRPLIAAALLFLWAGTARADWWAPGPTAGGSGATPNVSNATGLLPAANGGFSPPLAFAVTNYGAKCDGNIYQIGGTTSTGSNLLYIAQGVGGANYNFQQADVGATVTVSQTLVNTHSSTQPTAFTTTITGITTGGSCPVNVTCAVMAENAPHAFGGGSANVFWYHTDDTTAFTTASNLIAAFGYGNLVLPFGVCVSQGQIVYPNETITGEGNGASVWALANNTNTDLLLSQNYLADYANFGANGPGDVVIKDITLYGNNAANTATGTPGTYNAVGSGLRIYAPHLLVNDVVIENFAGDGMYTVWGSAAGSPYTGKSGLESHFVNINFFYNLGWGWTFFGSHDSLASNIITASNGLGGILSDAALNLNTFHGYQEAYPDLSIETVNGLYDHIIAEVGISLDAGATQIRNSTICCGSGTLTLGSGYNGNSTFYNTYANVLVNNSGNSGSSDSGFFFNYGSKSGNAYQPSWYIGANGQNNWPNTLNSGSGGLTISKGGMNIAGALSVTATSAAPPNGVYLSSLNTLDLTTSGSSALELSNIKHAAWQGSAPAVSACGTSPSIDAKATDSSGTVTVGSGTVASCTVTFANAYTTNNHCRVTPETSGIAAFAYSYTLSAITVTATSLTSDVFDYSCDGK